MDERFQAVLAEMHRQVDAGLRPSIQVTVDWRGERVFEAAYGDGATPKSLYLMWSTTKPFVAIALLQLVEEGRVELKERVAHYLPEFGQRGKETATLAHVLSHRGGFPDNTPELRRNLFRVMRDWKTALEYIYEMEAAWEPGTDRGYHAITGWFVLGELVQRPDDRPLAESLRARVLDPLGIAPGAFSLGEPERLSTAPMRVHTSGTRGAPGEAEAAFWNDPATHAAVIPGAGGISCSGEVVKLYRTLLDGGRGPNGQLLSAEMIRVATSPHVVGIRDRTFLRDIPWGLGFHLKHVISSLDDCGESATPGTFGHGGHFLVNTAWADPGKDLAVCILSNGLSEPRAGIRAVCALSQSVHDVVDRSSRPA